MSSPQYSSVSTGGSSASSGVLAPTDESKDLTVNGKLLSEAAPSFNYLAYLQKVKQLSPELPEVQIDYENVGYIAKVPAVDPGIKTLATWATGLFQFKKQETKDFVVMGPSTGSLKPGTMTLLLAPPGHGKTTFLKLLSGAMQPNTTGARVLFNGHTSEEALANKGVHVAKLVSYVDQVDQHIPHLTVRETFQFALDNNTISPENAQYKEIHKNKVDMMLTLLGLNECADTVVGDELLRGISGGQKKRTTLGEFLIGDSRGFFLDEVTTGLDAAASLDIFTALHNWVKIMRGTVVAALLQPSPELFAQFDQVILMREGTIIYDGPRESVMNYFESMGVHCPPDQDECDWITEFLTDPPAVFFRQRAREKMAIARGNPNLLSAPGKTLSTVAEQQTSRPNGGSPFTSPTQRTKHIRNLSESAEIDADAFPEDNNVMIHVDSAPSAVQMTAVNGSPFSSPHTVYNTISLGDGNSELPPLDTVALARRFRMTQAANLQQQSKGKTPALELTNEHARRQYGQKFPHSSWQHTKYNISRQAKITKRNTSLIIPRLSQAAFMGLVVATIFYRMSADQFGDRIGELLFAAVFMAFANFAEIPIAVFTKKVVYKQIFAGFYPASSYMLSVVLLHFPMAAVESFIFSTLLYWISNYTTSDSGTHYAMSFFIFLCMSLAISTVYRSVAFWAPNMEIAQIFAGPITVISMLFGGFLITYDKIPVWLQWVYWLSPFSWAVRSLALNEFKSSRYDEPFNLSSTVQVRTGDAYLSVWQIKTDEAYLWPGPAMLLVYWILFGFIGMLSLYKDPGASHAGTSRSNDDEEVELLHKLKTLHEFDDTYELRLGDSALATPTPAGNYRTLKTPPSPGQVTVQLGAPVPGGGRFLNGNKIGNGHGDAKAVKSTAASALPFNPMVLTWQNISYDVNVKPPAPQPGKVLSKEDIKKASTRRLLEDVSGYIEPGTLTALMGSSGAGKTTLMDVIAGRKTGGHIEGNILVNGLEVDKSTFSRLVGYVEQADLHIGTQTVHETLLFSARLRLPPEVTQEQREAFVQEVMDILELTELKDRLIGNENIPGLSPGQLKRVTIGVEAVANPPVLFLDEPTSGLDSRAALTVMRVIKKLALTGRTVLCTIHQPSAELFYKFDRLLLLASGGHTVFFGDIGRRGVELVKYFESIPGASKCPPRQNPANWMLDVIGAGTGVNDRGTSRSRKVNYPELYRKTPLHDEHSQRLELLSQPLPNSKAVKLSQYATSFMRQFSEVLYRAFAGYWRDVAFNATRAQTLALLGVLFGLVYFNLDVSDQPGVNSMIAVIFMTSAFCGVIHSSTALPVLARDRPVYYRERAAHTYQSYAYSFSIALVEVPYIFFMTILFNVPYYFLVGLNSDFTHFASYFLPSFLTGVIFSTMGQFLMAALPDLLIAQIVQGSFFTLFFLFGGIFIPGPNIPVGWKWFYYLNPVPKAVRAMTMPQFDCHGDHCISITVVDASGSSVKTAAQYVSDYLDGADFGANAYWEQLLWMFVFLIAFRIFASLAIQHISHIKR